MKATKYHRFSYHGWPMRSKSRKKVTSRISFHHRHSESASHESSVLLKNVLRLRLLHRSYSREHLGSR